MRSHPYVVEQALPRPRRSHGSFRADSPLATTAPKVSFSAPRRITVSSTSTPVAFLASGDINKDGHTDLVLRLFKAGTTTAGTTSAEILLGDGNGGFSITAFPGHGSDVASQLIDVDSDGILDYVSIPPESADKFCNVQPGTFTVFKGDGHGHFTWKSSFPLSPNLSVSLVPGDFNHDGKPDFAILMFEVDECPGIRAPFQVLINKGGGNFASGQSQELDSFQSNMVAGDFNGDGKLDLAYFGFKDINFDIVSSRT